MPNNWKNYLIIFAAGIGLGLLAALGFIRPSKKDIQTQLDWRDSIVRLNTELEYSRIDRIHLKQHSDSLMDVSSKNGLKFDSIQTLINNYKRNGSNEIKSVRHWNDARRDSFWRVEGSR